MSKKVMIVDDSRVVFEEMKYFLDNSGFEIVKYCSDGESAIVAYEEYQPDVVTMDIILPGMDGLAATQGILEKWPNAKIVLVSSLAYDETIEKGKQIGAIGFVYKPLSKPDLIGALLDAI